MTADLPALRARYEAARDRGAPEAHALYWDWREAGGVPLVEIPRPKVLPSVETLWGMRRVVR